MIEGYTKDLADWLGVGERRVRQLQQAEVFGRLPNGKYDVKACIQATLRHDAEAGVEQDHRRIKRRTRPMLGFKGFRTARRTLTGVEAMAMLAKGQVRAAPRDDLPAQRAFVHQVFGLAA